MSFIEKKKVSEQNIRKCLYVFLCGYGPWLSLEIGWIVYITYFQIFVFSNQFINQFIKTSVFTNLCILSFGLLDI